MDETKVIISKMEKSQIGYLTKAPFYPPKIYPELSRLLFTMETDKDNHVYETVRNAFLLMEMDKEHIGTNDWNPLSTIIKYGDTVVVKPNFVIHKNENDKTLFSTVTHGSVIRAVIDYVILALNGKGKIIIADAPQMDCDFEKLINKNGMKIVAKYYKKQLKGSGIDFDLIDLRRERTKYRDGVVWERFPLTGDPKGYTIVDLKKDSEFWGMDPKRFYGADYNRRQTVKAHSKGHHKYFVSNTVLQADVVISIPKLKVHKKTGVTLNLKNMVGINGDKNYLVHYQIGTPHRGGDEFSADNRIADLDRNVMDNTVGINWKYGKYLLVGYLKMKNLFGIGHLKNVNGLGNWWGNDTTWRMVVDLNKLLLYSNKSGKLSDNHKRRYLSVVDGIIGGEGDGPLQPRPVKSGVILLGTNPVAVDIVGTAYMGIDYTKIKLLMTNVRGKKKLKGFRTEDIVINSTGHQYDDLLKKKAPPYQYDVPNGWKGYL